MTPNPLPMGEGRSTCVAAAGVGLTSFLLEVTTLPSIPLGAGIVGFSILPGLPVARLDAEREHGDDLHHQQPDHQRPSRRRRRGNSKQHPPTRNGVTMGGRRRPSVLTIARRARIRTSVGNSSGI